MEIVPPSLQFRPIYCHVRRNTFFLLALPPNKEDVGAGGLVLHFHLLYQFHPPDWKVSGLERNENFCMMFGYFRATRSNFS